MHSESKTTKSFGSRMAPKAFSLTEILVVVAVLSLLLALSLPAIQHVQTKADKIKCAANLRQIGTYIQLYATENNGSLPGPAFLAVGQSLKLTRGLLTQINKTISLPVSGDQNCPFAICPTADKLTQYSRPATHFRRIGKILDESGNLFDPFGYDEGSQPLRMTVVSTRSGIGLSRIPMVYDRNMNGSDNPIHDGTRNYLFMDGHIESLAGQNPFEDLNISIN